jgi:Protein of unknown function (DUF1569)
MKNLFEPARVEEVKSRIAQLRPESQPQWGRMNVAQAVAHCAAGLQMAVGDIFPPPVKLSWRIVGRIVKPVVFGNDEPLRRNAPTNLAIVDQHDLAIEQQRLCALIDRFTAAGPAGCTTHPHGFFGKLTPDEWSTLMYKHLDHHLRQFGV